MPYNAYRILVLDPNDNDALFSAGEGYFLSGMYMETNGCLYNGTIIGIDGRAYGIPYQANLILKCYPPRMNFVGREGDESFFCSGGDSGRDGCVYTASKEGQVVKIDTANDSICFVGNSIDSDHDDKGWGNPVSGIDGCIYWPPYISRYILKYDPHAKQTSLVGDDFGNASSKWNGGSLASNGVVYCLPDHAERILSIDPWKEYTMSLENNMGQHPEQLGCIFNPNDDIPNETNFDNPTT